VVTGQTISVVDDDESMRWALQALLKSAGFQSETFASAEEFLDSGRLSDTACLVLDVRMEGITGLELQKQLVASGWTTPIIFITAHCGEEARAHALRRGAIEFLWKPFSAEALLSAISTAVGTPPG
jgi:FixJ family two-component response regulator